MSREAAKHGIYDSKPASVLMKDELSVKCYEDENVCLVSNGHFFVIVMPQIHPRTYSFVKQVGVKFETNWLPHISNKTPDARLYPTAWQYLWNKSVCQHLKSLDGKIERLVQKRFLDFLDLAEVHLIDGAWQQLPAIVLVWFDTQIGVILPLRTDYETSEFPKIPGGLPRIKGLV